MTRQLMSGNEAIARGALEAGVRLAAAYPGTPSTEILETIARHYPTIDARWSPNEKVALEVGLGAAIAGARTLVAMKHVGVNVAADPLFTLSYTGINAGLLLVTADDPAMHSSQNEQDNRHYARAAKVPLLEPSDSMEAKEMTVAAFDLSEDYDTPVMLRTTTRIAHSQSPVETAGAQACVRRPYRKDSAKYVMIPAHARARHLLLEQRLAALRKAANRSPLNRWERGESNIGVITSGACYQYVREALPQASVLKLGIVYPLPADLVRDFAASVARLYIVEELDPFIENEVKALGLPAKGKELFPLTGELSPSLISEAVAGRRLYAGVTLPPDYREQEIPPRPPVLCPGCGHRGAFYALKQLKMVVAGDIGCYTLGSLPPLEAMDSCICMGASIGAAAGMERANPDLKGRVVAVIGDSTFYHSGLTGLLDAVYNGSAITVLILDNHTTAMTGHQDHPGTGKVLNGSDAPAADPAAIARALGVQHVDSVDPLDLQQMRAVLTRHAALDRVSVIVARRPCALRRPPSDSPLRIDTQKCTGCGRCLHLGCPALASVVEDGIKRAVIDARLCNGCRLCQQLCRQQAITGEER